jgi:hypothetical protein
MNAGSTTWHHGSVRFGIQLLAASGSMIDKDYARQELPFTVAPGDSGIVSATIASPATPGHYTLKLDLVREGVSWFELTGSTPAVLPLQIE